MECEHEKRIKQKRFKRIDPIDFYSLHNLRDYKKGIRKEE